MDLRQNDDGSMVLYSDQEGKGLFRVGGPRTASIKTPQYRGAYLVKFPVTTGVVGTSGGGVFTNNTADDFIVGHTILDVTTAQTLTLNFTISVATAAAPTAISNVLIDTIAVQSTGTYNNVDNKGTSGASTRKFAVGSSLIITLGSSTANTWIGNLYATLIKA